MKPVLFQLGPFPVSSFGVFLLVAFVVGILVLRARTRGFGWDGGEVLDLSLYTIIGGVVGARIGYVLVNFPDFAGDPGRMLTIWKDAGLTFYGALAGGAIVAWLYGRAHRWSLGSIADAAAPSLALGYAIAMVGTLLYGLNYGRPSNLPWAVTLFGQARHPTQLYLMVVSLAIFALLMWRDGVPRAPGRLFWEFLFLYGIGRIIIEPFMDSPRILGSLTLAQAASIVAAAVAGTMWVILGRSGAETDQADRGENGPEAVEPRD
ncbi:MAG TPA: prolipoprotein diacylglyceryl transferase [bacterium]|nr:prolipoprotein diacylglyceryl transferase [bacterium]